MVAQDLLVDRQTLLTVMAKADKYELVLGENGALKVRLSSLEDTLGARNATIARRDTTIAARDKTITELRDDIKDLKTYRLILFGIAALAIGVIIWRFSRIFKPF